MQLTQPPRRLLGFRVEGLRLTQPPRRLLEHSLTHSLTHSPTHSLTASDLTQAPDAICGHLLSLKLQQKRPQLALVILRQIGDILKRLFHVCHCISQLALHHRFFFIQ